MKYYYLYECIECNDIDYVQLKYVRQSKPIAEQLQTKLNNLDVSCIKCGADKESLNFIRACDGDSISANLTTIREDQDKQKGYSITFERQRKHINNIT